MGAVGACVRGVAEGCGGGVVGAEDVVVSVVQGQSSSSGDHKSN